MSSALQLDIQFGPGIKPDTLPLSRPRIRRLIQASLPAFCARAELVLRWVGSAESRSLNRDYRGKDYATNILTFNYAPPPELRADLVICVPVARQESRTQKKRLDHHLGHLLVHGVLHASGLDHETDAQAQVMEQLEAQILQRFRIANPYA